VSEDRIEERIDELEEWVGIIRRELERVLDRHEEWLKGTEGRVNRLVEWMLKTDERLARLEKEG
jgi:hypothetical protein